MSPNCPRPLGIVDPFVYTANAGPGRQLAGRGWVSSNPQSGSIQRQCPHPDKGRAKCASSSCCFAAHEDERQQYFVAADPDTHYDRSSVIENTACKSSSQARQSDCRTLRMFAPIGRQPTSPRARIPTANLKANAIHSMPDGQISFANRSLWSFSMTAYLDIDELAELLGQSVRALRRNMRTAPHKVPPRMHIPGSKMLRWRTTEVKSWMFETGLSH